MGTADQIRDAAVKLRRTQEDVAYDIANAIKRELKPAATDYELDQLAQAIRCFLM